MCLCTLVQEFLLGTYLEVTFLGQIYDTTAECFLKCSRSDGVNQFTLPHSTQVQLTPSVGAENPADPLYVSQRLPV